MSAKFRFFLQQISCVLLLLPFEANAQDAKISRDTINTDRPDQSESPHLVRPGSLQVETGLSVSPFDSAGAAVPVIGMVVLRYGITKRLEARLMVEDGRERDRFLTETTQGVYPLAIGGKALLLDRESGIVPRTALLAWLKLPFTSRSDEQTKYWSPQILMAFENKITDRLEIEYNVGGKQVAYGLEWEGMGSASLHIELSERLTLFVEYFGQYQPGEDPVHNADGGLCYLVTSSFQLDVSAGRSLQAPPEQRNTFGSLGCSLRLPR